MSHKHEEDHSCAICDAMAAGKTHEEVIADILAGMVSTIAEKGVVVHAIDGQGEGPSFAYTTGLTEMGLPEVFMIGLPVQHAANGVYSYFQQIKDGSLDPELRTIESLFNLPLAKVDVSRVDAIKGLSDLCGFTTGYYAPKGVEVKWQQLVMCDPEGFMPWEPGFNHDLMDDSQPLFGVPAEIEEFIDLMNEQQEQDKDYAETVISPTIH